jgi:hypothetical protein
VSNAQVRREAVDSILLHLTEEGSRPELFDLAERKARRRAPGSLVPGKAPAKKAQLAPSPPLA